MTGYTTAADAQLAQTRRELAPLQLAADAAQARLADAEAKHAAVAEAPDHLGEDAHPSLRLALAAAAELVAPALDRARGEERAATAALRARRRDLLPHQRHPFSALSEAWRRADAARGAAANARLRLHTLLADKRRAEGVVAAATSGSDMARVAAAEAEARVLGRAIPAAREALARTEAAAPAAREAHGALERREAELRVEVVAGPADRVEAALEELFGIVGDPNRRRGTA